jgi:hypothetical protein
MMIFLLIIWSHLQAANNDSYHSFQLGLLYHNNINKNSFHHYWKHKWGLEIFTATPFYWGQLQTGLVVSSYKKKIDQWVNFNTYFLYFGWGIDWRLTNKLLFFTEINLGNTIMKFYPPKRTLEYIYDPEEEFSTRVACGLTIPFYKNLHYRVTVSYLVTYLNKKMELTFLSTGITYLFETPRWLIEFLK